MAFAACTALLIQVVGNTVAIPAFRELGHHSCRMRNAVAIGALRHCRVLRLMTEGAFKLAVFRLAGFEQAIGLGVAGSTVLGRNIFRILNLKRLMGPVAGETIGLGHFRAVRLVALLALRNEAVLVMTVGTCQGRMFAGELFQLFNLFRMAGQARIGNIAGQGYDERGMRICVAVKASFKLEMGLAGMAIVAIRDVVFYSWPMALMTVQTGDLGLMFAAVFCNRLWFGVVAFNAVINGQFRGCYRCGLGESRPKDSYTDETHHSH